LGISRQRYWGCPIPIVYDENNNPHKIPKEMFQLNLPVIEKLDETGNPLDKKNGKILILMEKIILEKQIL
jgi:leucyl-tRNA synthetase